MPRPENRLVPVNIDSESNDEVLALELDAVEVDGAELEFTEGAFHKFAHLLAACAHEMLADRRLFDAIGLGKLAHDLRVIPGREAEHEFVPDGGVERLGAPEQRIAAQGLFVAIVAAQPRALDGDLLSIDDEEAFLAAPAIGLVLLFAPLVALAGELAHFVVHDELQQPQACLAHQLADAVLQRGGDFLERQVQLQFLPALFGLLVEPANGLFAADLVSFLHSDSPYLKDKHHSEPNGSEWRVATSYELSDILPSSATPWLSSSERLTRQSTWLAP